MVINDYRRVTLVVSLAEGIELNVRELRGKACDGRLGALLAREVAGAVLIEQKYTANHVYKHKHNKISHINSHQR
jgi:hypothetical protein